MFCGRRTDVAQLVEQRFRNLASYPRRTFRHWTACEQIRRLATENDGHFVNMRSTACNARKRKLAADQACRIMSFVGIICARNETFVRCTLYLNPVWLCRC
jgi:hypothetical protein